MSQNLVSYELKPEVKERILKNLAQLKEDLAFTIAVLPDDKNQMVKVGNTYLPFIDMAYQVVSDHPEMMSGLFDMAEYKRDYALSKDLVPITNQVRELLERLENTSFAVTGDSMSASLEVYSTVQANKERVPGLNAIAASMKEFFKRTKSKTVTPE